MYSLLQTQRPPFFLGGFLFQPPRGPGCQTVKEVMADAAENPMGRLRAGSGEVLDAVDLAEELDFDDEAGGHRSRWL